MSISYIDRLLEETCPGWQVPVMQGLLRHFQQQREFEVTPEHLQEALQQLASCEEDIPRKDRVGYGKLASYPVSGLLKVASRLNPLLNELALSEVTPSSVEGVAPNSDILNPEVRTVFSILVTSDAMSSEAVQLLVNEACNGYASVLRVASTSAGNFDVMISSKVPRAIISDYLVDVTWIEQLCEKPIALFGV